MALDFQQKARRDRDDPDAGRQLIRWAFCKQTSVIEEALSRLAGADLAYG